MFCLCLISTVETGLFESQNNFRRFSWICYSAYMKTTVCCPVCIAWTCSLPDFRMHDATHVHSSSQHPYTSMQRWTLKAGQGFIGRIRAGSCIAKQQKCGHLKETAVPWLSLCKTLRSVSRALCHTFCLIFLLPYVAEIFVNGMEMILFPRRN